MKYLLLVLYMLSACGKCPNEQSQNFVEFRPVVMQFVSDAQAHGRSVDISHLVVVTQDMPVTSTAAVQNGVPGVLYQTESGVCEYTPGNPTIRISTIAWNTWTASAKEALLYHELGHCLLMRGHNPNIDASGNPVSLMYPYTFDGGIYQQNRTNYLNELFDN